MTILENYWIWGLRTIRFCWETVQTFFFRDCCWKTMGMKLHVDKTVALTAQAPPPGFMMCVQRLCIKIVDTHEHFGWILTTKLRLAVLLKWNAISNRRVGNDLFPNTLLVIQIFPSPFHAIYVSRRIQDYAESKGARLTLFVLDWEKTFEKIQHNTGLRRIGFSFQHYHVIQYCYENCFFFYIENAYIVWEAVCWHEAGPPFIPIFFVIVISCIGFGIRSKCSRWVTSGRMPSLTFDMVYYADDTILFSIAN